MTFTEAALAVLEREGRPMAAKEIAEKALAWNLLSHVGKTPEQTMSTRISAAVAKGPGKGPFVRVKPGVFALEKWGGKAPGPTRQPQAAKQEAPRRDEPPAKRPEIAEPAERDDAEDDGDDEADADDPAKLPQGAKQEGEPTGRKRRRRRRKKRGPDDASPGAPQAIPADAAPQPPRHVTPPPPPPPPKPAPAEAPARQREREPFAEEAELGDKIEAFLRKENKPAPLDAIAEHLGYKGRNGRLLIEAVLTADRMEQEQRGERARFVQHRGVFALSEREVSSEILALEQQVAESVARLRRLAEQKLARKIRSLDVKALAKLVALYLRRFGFGEAQPVERGSGDELHLSVQDRRRGGRFHTAVVVRRDGGRALAADAVTDLRGSLHHYRSTRGMIITTGQITDEARAEAEVQNLAPIALVDGDALARELIRFGVGIRERSVRLPVFDDALLAELGG